MDEIFGDTKLRFIVVAAGGYRGDIAIDKVIYSPSRGFHSNYRAFLNSNGSTVVLTENPTPRSGDIVLRWNSITQRYSADLLSSAAGSWSSRNIEFAVGDFNLDGAQDALLKNFGNIVSPNVSDYIVFGNSNESLPPVGLVEADESFERFFSDIQRWTFEGSNDQNFLSQFTSAIFDTFTAVFGLTNDSNNGLFEQESNCLSQGLACNTELITPSIWFSQNPQIGWSSCTDFVTEAFFAGFFSTELGLSQNISEFCSGGQFYITYGVGGIVTSGRQYTDTGQQLDNRAVRAIEILEAVISGQTNANIGELIDIIRQVLGGVDIGDADMDEVEVYEPSRTFDDHHDEFRFFRVNVLVRNAVASAPQPPPPLEIDLSP